MKARLKFTVLIFLVTVRFTEELTWNTEMRATVCCQGKTQLLIWNFNKGENELITALQWYFNEKTLVCLESETTGFLVSDLYAGRVERNGTAGILLKNVSLNDTGEYTLYVKLKEEKGRNVQGINLTVVEPPPNQCKPIIKKEHPKGIIYCSTSCERSPLSLEWTINGTKDPGDSGPYFVVKSSGTSEQPTCCLRDFKCVDDYQTKFCTQNNISFTEDMHTVNESVADTNHMDYTPILIIQIVIPVVLINVVTAIVILNRRRCWLFFAVHKCDYTTTQNIEGDQHERLLSDQNSPILPKDLEPHSDFNDVQAPVPVESNSNTVLECNKDLQQALTVDRPLQDSNQHVQIVNNISIEIWRPKRYRKTDWRKLFNRCRWSFVITQAKRNDFKNNDTDTFETTESEDTFSEKPSSVLGTVQDLDAGLRHDQRQEKTFPILDADDQQIQLQVPVKSKSSNTGLECNEDLQQALTVAANTVEPKHSITVAQCNEDLQQVPTVAPTTESRKMKWQLHLNTDLRRKENRHEYLFEMKQEECSDINNKPLVHHGCSEGVVSC